MTALGASILVVDDEQVNRRVLAALLEPEGYIIRTAASGQEALASVARAAPDLILLDVMMAGMDGREVTRALKADPKTRSIPVIMVTAQTDREARLAALDSGAEDFLTKPIDRAELWLRVRNLLRLKELSDLVESHRATLELDVQARTKDLQRFRTAMDSTGDAIFLIDHATMRFLEVNATASQMLGYSREELLAIGPAEVATRSRIDFRVAYDALVAGGNRTSTTETARRKDGSDLPVEVHRHAQQSGGRWIIVAVLRDITERQEAEARLQQLAHFDALTGLPNRTLFYGTLEKAGAHALAHDLTIAVLFLDIDYFKSVNDTLGHAAGDELLIQISERLLGCVRIRDTVARLGGDEFGVILTMAAAQHGQAALVARKIQAALRKPFLLRGNEVTVTASIGLTLHPDDSTDPATLVKYADTAMYQAKQAGRDGFRFFTSAMNVEVMQRLELETALRTAFLHGEFVLHYQPKVQIASGQIAGVEALLRWQRPGHGLVPPAEFIPILEETGLIVDVGGWVIAAVCEQIATWLRCEVGPVQVSVNVSERQFVRGDLEGVVIAALDSNDVPAHLLELELTETALMGNTEHTVGILRNLKTEGVQISIDDFGTGYSSLAYLRRFPIDTLKIDRSFIDDVTNNPDDAAIALAIIRMAHSLNLDVVAEGVETSAQLAYLSRHRCDLMQGYLFSRPLPLGELESLLLASTSLPAADGHALATGATLLLVDDDEHVLDSLRILFNAEGYEILCATSGAKALELLALNEVQVMICDPHISSMTGNGFLGRVKNLHPATLQIVLSECVDPSAIIATINAGGVYRYYRKPWIGQELVANVREAVRRYWSVAEGQVTGPAATEPRDDGEGCAATRREAANQTYTSHRLPL